MGMGHAVDRDWCVFARAFPVRKERQISKLCCVFPGSKRTASFTSQRVVPIRSRFRQNLPRSLIGWNRRQCHHTGVLYPTLRGGTVMRFMGYLVTVFTQFRANVVNDWTV